MEPGIYFNEQLLSAAQSDARGASINWQRVDALRKFGGIRVEDNLAVTDCGLREPDPRTLSTATAGQ